MKNLFLVFIVYCFTVVPNSLFAQNKAKKENMQSVYNRSKQTILSNNYEFKADLVFDGNQREKNTTSIIVNMKKLNAEIVPLGKNNLDAIRFKESSIKNYDVTFNEREKDITIKFNSKANSVDYNFKIEIKPNNKAFLEFTSQNTAYVQYIGTVVKI